MPFLGLEDYMVTCTNKKIFGVECIGCGAQRATAFLIKGDFTNAFNVFPAIYAIVLLVLFVGFNLFVKFKYDFQIKLVLLYFTAVAAVVSYGIKILPFLKIH